MAGKIRGITIELGGDASGLMKAVQNANKEIKNTQAQLKDVNKLLKLDPGNVTLLEQKQRLLADAVDQTRDKLTEMEAAAERANDALQRGDITQAQYDAIQREVIATKDELKNATDAARDFGGVAVQQFAAVGEKVEEVGGKISDAGDALTKYVTGPIVAAGAAALAAFGDVDEGLDIIIKKTGATGPALEGMETAAKNIATSMATDFTTAGTAVGEVNTRFGLTGDALEDLSARFIKFADLNGTDVNSSIDNVQAAMTAFNLEGDQAGIVLDILNKAAQDTGVDVGKLTGDLTTNAAALREMGFDINSATGFIAGLNKNGLDASTVMTGLKTAMKTASSEGDTLAHLLEIARLGVKNFTDDADKMVVATSIFGSKAAPTMKIALEEGRISFSASANAVTDYSDSVNATFEATQDPIDEFKVALNGLKIVGADLVETAAPLITTVAHGAKDAITTLRTAWEGLTPEMQQTIIKSAGIAAAVGPVLSVGGKLIKGVGTLMTKAPQLVSGIKSVKTALSGVWAAMSANPIGATIAVVAALTAGFIYLWNNCEGFRQFFIDLGATLTQVLADIKAGAGQMIDWIVSGLSGAWERIRSGASQKWGEIKADLSGVWGDMKQGATNMGAWIVDGLSGAWESVSATAQQKWDNIKAAYEAHGGGLEGIAAATWEAIKGWYTFGFDAINDLTGGKLDGIKQLFSDAFDLVGTTVSNALEYIKGLFNFEWHLPKIPLPHFSIVGEFSLMPPSVPKLSVDWYAKAMANGMILTSPTILPAMDGTYRGYGDAGPEAVVGVSSLRSMIQDAVAGVGKTSGGPRMLTVILQVGRQEAARMIYELNNEETQRVGVDLTKR